MGPGADLEVNIGAAGELRSKGLIFLNQPPLSNPIPAKATAMAAAIMVFPESTAPSGATVTALSMPLSTVHRMLQAEWIGDVPEDSLTCPLQLVGLSLPPQSIFAWMSPACLMQALTLG